MSQSRHLFQLRDKRSHRFHELRCAFRSLHAVRIDAERTAAATPLGLVGRADANSTGQLSQRPMLRASPSPKPACPHADCAANRNGGLPRVMHLSTMMHPRVDPAVGTFPRTTTSRDSFDRRTVDAPTSTAELWPPGPHGLTSNGSDGELTTGASTSSVRVNYVLGRTATSSPMGSRPFATRSGYVRPRRPLWSSRWFARAAPVV